MSNNTMIISASLKHAIPVGEIKKRHIIPVVLEGLTEGALTRKEIITLVANEFGFEADENQTLYERTNWAIADIKAAGYTFTPKWGTHQLTDVGEEVNDLLLKLKANDKQHEVVYVFVQINSQKATLETGADALNDLRQLVAELLPKEEEIDVVSELIALRERVAYLEAKLEEASKDRACSTRSAAKVA